MTSKKFFTLFAIVIISGCGKSNDSTESTSPIPAIAANCAGQGCLDSSLALQVQSQTSLTGTLSLGTEAGQIEAARFAYTLLNGPSEQFSLSTSPTQGFLGELNEVIGILSTGLKANSYASCSAIPTSGTLTIQEGSDTYSLTFAGGSRALPASFATAASFGKQIRVLKNGSLHLIAELACDSGSLVSGYFRLSTELREIEVYSQADSSTHFSHVELYASGSSETFAARFKTDDGSAFNLWIVRPGTTSLNLGVEGQRNLSLAHVRTHSGTLSDTTAITSSAHETCLDLATGGTSTACATNSLVVTDAAASAPLKDAQTYAFNILSIASMELTALE